MNCDLETMEKAKFQRRSTAAEFGPRVGKTVYQDCFDVRVH